MEVSGKVSEIKNYSDIILELLRLSIIIALMFIAMPILEQTIGSEKISRIINQAGPVGVLGYLLLKVLSIVIPQIPFEPVTIIFNRNVGFWVALFYSIITILIGGSINFFISRKFGHQIKALVGKRIIQFIKLRATRLSDKSWLFVVFLFFGFSFKYTSYVLGMSNVSYSVFIKSMLPGSISITLLCVLRDINIGSNNSLAFACLVGVVLINLLGMYGVKLLCSINQ